ncbi:MAG: serine hydrolase [Rhodobiaceae bacterium]|nr:serine hydrolase [Rhodobiaceae bacterium]
MAFVAAFLSVFISVVTPAPAQAAEKYAALVADGFTGRVVFARNADDKRYPASLTKIMTLYILFEEMEAGRMSMSTRLKVSSHAAAQAPSKLGLKPGQTIAVQDAILALVTKSANDIAVVVAEGIEGSESAFASRMTRTARRIGMDNTTYRNASGLPDRRQMTTARDQMTLARDIMRRFPEQYKLFRTKTFSYAGRRYGNHNHLLGNFQGTEGIKTGYIRDSGFNLVATVRRDGKLLVGVVMGGKTGRSRDAHMRDILTASFPKVRPGQMELYAKLPHREEIPMPAPKPDAIQADVIQTASAGGPVQIISMPRSVTTIPIPVPAGQTEEQRASMAELVVETRADAPSAAQRPAADQGSAEIASTSPNVGGWVIQIGAFPNKDSAEDKLNGARSDAGHLLGSAAPFTEPVEKNGATLWRARFAGFDQSSAKAACAYLKRRDYACFAARN